MYKADKNKTTTHIFLFPHIKIDFGQRNSERYSYTAFPFTKPLGYQDKKT